MEEMTESQEAAAWHGLATNAAFSLSERLACALKALDWYETAEARGYERAIEKLRIAGEAYAWSSDVRQLYAEAADFLEEREQS